MNVGFYTTAVRGAGTLNDMADVCLSPVRTLLSKDLSQEKVYHYLGSSHYLVETVASRVDTAVQRVFAAMAVSLFFPLVAFGVILKSLAAYNGAKEPYASIRKRLQTDNVYLTDKGLGQKVDPQFPNKEK